MNLKAVSLACSLLLGGSLATAADHPIGTFGPGSIFMTTSSFGAQTDIDDDWLFSLSASSGYLLGFILNTYETGGIESFSATLSGPNGFSVPWTVEPVSTLNGQGAVYEGYGLSPGNYVLHVYGKTTLAGDYTVGFAAAVPEPSTYAMLLAGLALAGFAARRRMR